MPHAPYLPSPGALFASVSELFPSLLLNLEPTHPSSHPWPTLVPCRQRPCLVRQPALALALGMAQAGARLGAPLAPVLVLDDPQAGGLGLGAEAGVAVPFGSVPPLSFQEALTSTDVHRLGVPCRYAPHSSPARQCSASPLLPH